MPVKFYGHADEAAAMRADEVIRDIMSRSNCCSVRISEVVACPKCQSILVSVRGYGGGKMNGECDECGCDFWKAMPIP